MIIKNLAVEHAVERMFENILEDFLTFQTLDHGIKFLDLLKCSDSPVKSQVEFSLF